MKWLVTRLSRSIRAADYQKLCREVRKVIKMEINPTNSVMADPIPRVTELNTELVLTCGGIN